VTYQHGFLE